MGRTSDANIRLMHAALDLMWEESYGAVTIDDICKRADVKKGSFYYFFASKAELAVAALELMWVEESKPKLDNVFSSSVPPLERFKTYLESVYTLQAEIKAKNGKVLGCAFCSVGSETCTQQMEVNAKIREIWERKSRYFVSSIRDAIAAGDIEPCDPEQTALAIVSMIDGLISHARVMNEVEVLRELPAMAFSLLRAKKPVSVATASHV